MRALTFVFLALGTLITTQAAAMDWNTLMATNPQARWNACYKETRLLYRTRNLSEQQYRVAVKATRRVHMQDCMTRAEPPRPTAIPEIDERMPKGAIAGWARNP